MLHELADLRLLRILGFLAIEGPLQIHHVVSMGSTTTIALRIDGGVRLLGEVGGIDRTLARLLLQGGPRVGRPSEAYIARSIAQAEEALLVGSARI